jgi:hypothetical protein
MKISETDFQLKNLLKIFYFNVVINKNSLSICSFVRFLCYFAYFQYLHICDITDLNYNCQLKSVVTWNSLDIHDIITKPITYEMICGI